MILSDASAMAADPDRNPLNETQVARVLAAYYQAAEQSRAPDRQALLAQHPDLADELTRHFAFQDRLSVLAEPLRVLGSLLADEALAPPADVGRTIGDYKLLGELARGGMGIVYRARQLKLDRLVALKVCRDGVLAGKDDLTRFRNEAQAVANLDHPNIVPIHEVGEHEGACYYSMKLVEGGSLAARLPEYTRDPARAARLLATVARAVHHAHEKGILHRDLKPSNILIDSRGEPLVADFGLACRLDGPSDLTRTGDMLGTPSFMSPEQASGKRNAVTPRTDVHGLGAILYALLTGRPPFQGENQLETLTLVRERPPQPPRFSTAAVDPNLETICLKCLEKDPRDRYPSARAVAEELEAWLAGRPIEARPVTQLERLLRHGRGHPRAALLGVIAAGLLVAALAALEITRRALSAAALERQAARKAETELERRQYLRGLRLAGEHIRDHRLADAHALIDSLPTPAEPADLEGFPRLYLERLLALPPAPLAGHQGDVYYAAFSPDGRTLATASRDFTTRLWDVPTRRCRAILQAHTHEVGWAAFSPDGKTLAVAGQDRAITLWDTRSGALMSTLLGHADDVLAAVFLHHAHRLVSCARSGEIILWDLGTRTPERRFQLNIGEVQSLDVSPDDRLLLLAASTRRGPAPNRPTIVWDLAAGREAARLLDIQDFDECAVFSHDGQWVATAGNDDHARLWRTSDWSLKATLPGSTSRVRSVAFAPDDRVLAACDEHGGIHRWDLATGERETLSAGPGWNWCVAWSPDARILAVGARDGSVRLWDQTRDRNRIAIEVRARTLPSMGLTRDGLLRIGDNRGAFSAYDVPSGRLVAAGKAPTQRPVLDAVISQNGERMLTHESDGATTLWELPTLRKLAAFQTPPRSDQSFVLSPAGAWLERNGDSAGGAFPRDFWALGDQVEHVELSMWGGTISALDDRGLVSIDHWDRNDPTVYRLPSGARIPPSGPGHSVTVNAAAFAPDGRWLASGGRDRKIIFWNLENLRPTLSTVRASSPPLALQFSPDGRWLASGHVDGLVRIWDVAFGQEVLTLDGHVRPVERILFSPDGRTLATCSIAVNGFYEVFLWPTRSPD